MDKWLAPVFGNLVNEFSDCRIFIGEQKFHCHRVILASASGFFKGMFSGDMKESVSGDVHLNNITPDIFEKFRKYVYTYNNQDLCQYSTDTIMDLYDRANQWFVPSLVSDSTKILGDRIRLMKVEELMKMFEFAHGLEIRTLIDEIILIIAVSPMKYLQSKEALLLGSDAFYNFMKYLARNTILPEIERYDMIEKYLEMNGFIDNINPIDNINDFKDLSISNESPAKDTRNAKDNSKCEKMQLNANYVKSLINTINFVNMSTEEFYSGPGKSKFLTWKMKYELICSIIKKRQHKNFFERQ